MPIYFRQGNKPAASPGKALICNKCEVFTAIRTSISYDTERDAKKTWQNFGQIMLNVDIPMLWAGAWNAFTCPPNLACQTKEACANKPVYVEAGSDTAVDPATGAVVWVLYVVMAREIRCIQLQPGAQPPPDVTPEIPLIPHQEPPHTTPQPPSPEPLPKPGDLGLSYPYSHPRSGQISLLFTEIYATPSDSGSCSGM